MQVNVMFCEVMETSVRVCVSSVPRHAPGGNGCVVVERGVGASQASHGAELLPQRIPGPAHHPGATYGFKHVSQKGKRRYNSQYTLQYLPKNVLDLYF